MPLLTKKSHHLDSVEAYACACVMTVCSCACYCTCSCSPAYKSVALHDAVDHGATSGITGKPSARLSDNNTA